MASDKADIVRQWLIKAKNDLALAEVALKASPSLLDGAVFHCQQAAEKALKGYLTWHDQLPRRTHQLPDLVLDCCVIDSTFASLEDAAETLSPYATSFRYPGPTMEPEVHEVEHAIHLATNVVAFVTRRLPREAIP